MSAAQTNDQPFCLGLNVRHVKWGPRVVHQYERDLVMILFDSVGYRSLGLEVVADNGLLQAASKSWSLTILERVLLPVTEPPSARHAPLAGGRKGGS